MVFFETLSFSLGNVNHQNLDCMAKMDSKKPETSKSPFSSKQHQRSYCDGSVAFLAYFPETYLS